MAGRTHRLHVARIEDEFVLDGDRTHYLRDVLRVREGEEFLIFDGRNEFEATVKRFNKRECVVERGVPTRQANVRARLHLCHAAIKSSLDLVVQVATELAVTDFWIFGSARSNAPARVRRDRLERIAQGAAEQCQRVSTPTIREARDLPELLTSLSGVEVYFGDIAPGDDGHSSTTTRFESRDTNIDVAILIGPEGGWTQDERALLQAQGARAVHFGPQVLRATTAGHTALTALHTERGWPVDAIRHEGANG